MRWLVWALTVLALGTFASFAQVADPFGTVEVSSPLRDIDPSLEGVLERKLDRLVIPEIDFEEVPFIFLLEFLTTRSVELDTETLDPVRKGVDIVNRSPGENETPITLNLKNVKLGEALRSAASLAGKKAIVAGSVIEIAAANAEPVPEITIPEGSRGRGSLEEKFATVYIPRIEFENIPLSVALQLIGEKAAEIDSVMDPEGEGIEIDWEGDAGSFDEPRIDLRMSWQRLGEVLKYTAALSGQKVHFDGSAVIFRPK